jgi:hypothetical protein
MEHDFDILAARVLSGEATPEEIGRLKQLLAQNAQLRSEFAELRATWSVLKDTAPLAQSFDERPSEPPKERLKQWQEALERRRLSRPNLIESTKTPVARAAGLRQV